jgi:hypothetical protein
MCQDVSFVKSEDKLDYYCRNILAVSNNIICYSVTQKRNLMRLIDTQSGEKGILRGHEAGITDLSISPKDENLLCSVDYSDGSSSDPKNGSHFFVWQKAYGSEKNIDFNMLAKSSISGYILAAHPLQSNIWAVSNGEKLAVVSTGKLAGAYESYSMHVVMEGGERITSKYRSYHHLTSLCHSFLTLSPISFPSFTFDPALQMRCSLMMADI